MTKNQFILKLNTLDEKGIIARITMPLYEIGCMITCLSQFSDSETGRFFMRLAFECEEGHHELEKKLTPILASFEGTSHLYESDRLPRFLLLCSKPDHCVIDLLAKMKRGSLPIDIVAVASNHQDLRPLVEWHGLPYHYLPVTKATREQQEQQIAGLIEETGAEYVILARYMQILSNQLCDRYAGRIINIHHSFLPSFKGAHPYTQAHQRGVKVIGATAHFVTADLDEGPIIWQEVIPVNHSHTPHDLTTHGADVESLTLSKAVKYIAERRVFLNGQKTVVLK